MDNTLRLKFDPLSDDNYEIWINHIRDKLLVENLEDVCVCSEIEAGEDGHQFTIPTAANAATAKRPRLEVSGVLFATTSAPRFTPRHSFATCAKIGTTIQFLIARTFAKRSSLSRLRHARIWMILSFSSKDKGP